MDQLDRIQEALREGRVSQSELARASGVAQGTIGNIQHGRVSPRWATVARVADALAKLEAEAGAGVAAK